MPKLYSSQRSFYKAMESEKQIKIDEEEWANEDVKLKKTWNQSKTTNLYENEIDFEWRRTQKKLKVKQEAG